MATASSHRSTHHICAGSAASRGDANVTKRKRRGGGRAMSGRRWSPAGIGCQCHLRRRVIRSLIPRRTARSSLFHEPPLSTPGSRFGFTVLDIVAGRLHKSDGIRARVANGITWRTRICQSRMGGRSRTLLKLSPPSPSSQPGRSDHSSHLWTNRQSSHFLLPHTKEVSRPRRHHPRLDFD